MKKILILASVISLLFAVGCEDKEDDSNNPPTQASITGSGVNECPDETVTLTASAKGATTFEWRRNGLVLLEQTTSTLVVSQAGEYRVSGLNQHGQGSLSEVKSVTFVSCVTLPLQATISGNESNICPAHSVTLTATAQSAVTFQWKKDGVILPGHTTSTLIVHEAGVYTVAGINEVGIGAFSGGKTVTISECVPFIDLLVGLWDATGAVWFDNKTMYNNHSFTIEKINDTTIKINNFDGSEVEGINNVITATVDNVARTIFIPFQHSLTQFSWQGDEIWYSRAAHPHPCQNAGDIGTLEVDGIGQNLSVTFPHKYVGGELGGVLCNVTYHMLFYTGETCRGVAAWGANTVWTKRK